MHPNEDIVHQQVCRYIKAKYPDVIFNSDGAGNNLSKAQAGKAKMLRSRSGFPDLFIAEARGEYHGMFLEIKSMKATLYKKDGTFSTDDHIQKQAQMLLDLRQRCFYADFGQGTDECIRKIDWYLSLKSYPQPAPLH